MPRSRIRRMSLNFAPFSSSSETKQSYNRLHNARAGLERQGGVWRWQTPSQKHEQHEAPEQSSATPSQHHRMIAIVSMAARRAKPKSYRYATGVAQAKPLPRVSCHVHETNELKNYAAV